MLEANYKSSRFFATEKVGRNVPFKDRLSCQETSKLVTINSGDLFFVLGTPITCHGLDNSPQLNGRVGDLRAWDKETDNYQVHFEDNTLEQCWIKRSILLICFELPDK